MGRTYEIKDKNRLYEDEVPAHPVDISPFRMGATHVTVGMWREYLRGNSSLSMPTPTPWGWNDSHPMVNVSWFDIMGTDGKGGYAAWASRVAGVRLILPSEAQWEYVAKGGKQSKYPWGNEYDDSKVWCSVKTKRHSTAAVDRLNNVFANNFGVVDMSSNVTEWCLDGDRTYIKSFDRLGYVRTIKDPVGHIGEGWSRGVSWDDTGLEALRSSHRGGLTILGLYDENEVVPFGFRLTAGSKLSLPNGVRIMGL